MMSRRRSGRGDGEAGYILVTTVLVTVAVFTLGAVIVSLSIENSSHSAGDRRRLQSIDALEAGINYYYSQLQSTPPASAPCSVTQTLSTAPAAFFTVTPTFYNTSTSPPMALPCPPPSTAGAVLIRSVGTASSALPVRTMEAYVRLVPVTGGTLGPGGIFADRGVNFKANANIFGSAYNDATVYSNGDITSSANGIFNGDVLAQGSITLGSNSEVKGSVWAGGAVSISSNSVVRLDTTSAASTISLASGGRIYGNAKAAGAISLSGGASVNGLTIPNVVSAYPPVRPSPAFNFVLSDWLNAGYQVQTYASGTNTDCTNAESFLRTGIPSGNWVVRITTACALTFTNNITVHGNLALITNGPVTFATNTRFSPQSGTGPWDVFFVVGLSGTAPCDFTTNPQSGFDAGLDVLVYTPSGCSVTMNSTSALSTGQIFSGYVNWLANVSFGYKQVILPGSPASGFKEDVKCLREVATGSALPAPPAC